MTYKVFVEIELTVQSEDIDETVDYLRQDLTSELGSWLDEHESINKLQIRTM